MKLTIHLLSFGLILLGTLIGGFIGSIIPDLDYSLNPKVLIAKAKGSNVYDNQTNRFFHKPLVIIFVLSILISTTLAYIGHIALDFINWVR